MTHLRFVPAWAVIVLALGCAGATPNGSPRPVLPTDRNLITQEEFTQRRFATVYAAVEALRPNWLAKRGPGNGEIQVYLDGQLFGGVAALLTIPVPTVESIRHLDGIEAAARYGRGHDMGAILVKTIHGGN